MLRIALIPGDGIGADVTAEAVKVLRTVAARIGILLDTLEWDLGAERYLRSCAMITLPRC